MLAYATADGGRQVERLVTNDVAAAVARGKERLESNDMDADDAVLVHDARIPAGPEKLDAIVVEARAYFSPGSVCVIAVPYTPKPAGGFRVHKPNVLAWDNCEDFDLNVALQVFWEGVAAHEKGAKVWNDCLDESK